MSDGDGVRDENEFSKTGKFARVDLEPRLDPERNKRKIKSEVSEDKPASTTGIMRAFIPPEASSQTDDEDQPAE